MPFGVLEDPTGKERGLLFLSYQASIGEQFEFLARNWMNSPTNPDPSPPSGGAGFDLLVGQNNATVGGERFCLLGEAQQRVSTDGHSPQTWVIPSGGGYFFAPAQSAIRDVLIGAKGSS